MTEEKLDFKKVLSVFVIALIDLLGLTIVIPVLPLYAVSFGAGAEVYGLLGAAYPVMQFLGAPLLGRLSDRFGRKPVLVVSQIGTFVGFLILGFANGLWMLFLARIVDGISGANISTAQAVITDSTTEKMRTQGLGLIGAAFGLGFIIGPIIAFASLSISRNNYAVPAFVAAGFSLLSILLTAFWLPETLPTERRGKASMLKSAFAFRAMFAALGRPSVGILLALMFAQQLVFGGFEMLLALFTLNRLGMDASDNSMLFVFVGVLVVVVQGYFVGQWSQCLGDRKLIYLGLAALALGLVLAAVTPRVPVAWYDRQHIEGRLTGEDFRTYETTPTHGLVIPLPPEERRGWLGLAWILAAMVPVSLGGGILRPSINSLITKRVDGDEIGGMLGISASFYSAANALAPVIGGAMFAWLGSTAPFLAGGVLLGLLFVLALQSIKPGQEELITAGLARGGAQ